MMVVNGTKNNIPNVILLTSWLIFAVVVIVTTIHPDAIITINFCSAWIVQHPPHNHNKRNQHRQQSRFYSTSTTTTTSTEATTTPTTTTATPNNLNGNISAAEEEYKQLYPQSTTRTNGTILTEDGIHTLHYEIYGTGSLNALFLHGGPGSGCFPNHARFFDPTKYRVVLLDQRGAGRSSPTACVINNTLSHLVDDCELLRKHLLLQDQEEDEEDVSSSSISSSSSSSWDVILGGSWGTTVALAYAQTYPKSMKSLILRGICTFRPSEIDWLFNKNCGSAMKLTDSWKNFSAAVNSDSDSDNDRDSNNNEIDNSQDNNDGREVLHAYYDRLMAKTNDTNNMMLDDNNTSNGKPNDDVSVVDNNAIRLTAARSWMMWEMAASSSFKQNNNQSADTGNDDTRNVVLVSGPGDNYDRGNSWWFENHRGEIVHDYSDDSPETIVSQIRQGIVDTTTTTTTPNTESTSGRPRPVRPIKSIPPVQASNDTSSGRFRVPQDYIPAQAMLTCYYSVNDIFVMGGPNCKNLLSKESCSNLDPDLKIIGIQGGRDPICPPDTAIDLKAQLSESKIMMELRISLLSGHSMYDPAIMNEIIQATDKLANEFLVSSSESDSDSDHSRSEQ